MPHVRTCGEQCHNAKHDKCRCWCGGFFHGGKGAANRVELEAAILHLVTEGGVKLNDIEFGAKNSETRDRFHVIRDRLNAEAVKQLTMPF